MAEHDGKLVYEDAAAFGAIMWLSLYVILNKIIMKELVITNAEHDTKWHKKWPFAADQFTSVKRDRKLKQLGL